METEAGLIRVSETPLLRCAITAQSPMDRKASRGCSAIKPRLLLAEEMSHASPDVLFYLNGNVGLMLITSFDRTT